MFNPQTSPGGGSFYSRQIEAAAATFAMQPIPMPLRNATEIEPAVAEFARHSNSGLVIVSDSFVVVHRELIMGLAARHRLPAIYPFRYFATEGGLASYGVDRDDFYRREPPMSIAYSEVRSPLICRSKHQLNSSWSLTSRPRRRSASTVPPTLLTRADEVIE